MVISSFAPSSILNREFDSLLGPGSSYFQARLRRRGLHLKGGGGGGQGEGSTGKTSMELWYSRDYLE